MWGLSHYDCALGTVFLTLWYGGKNTIYGGGERGRTRACERGGPWRGRKGSSFFCFKYLEDTPKGDGEKALNKRINKIASGHFIIFFFRVDSDFLRVVLLWYKNETDFLYFYAFASFRPPILCSLFFPPILWPIPTDSRE